MNDEVKEILIDLIDYYNVIGTDKDPGFGPFADVVGRASNALRRHAKEVLEDKENKKSADVDPFAITDEFPAYKLEDEW